MTLKSCFSVFLLGLLLATSAGNGALASQLSFHPISGSVPRETRSAVDEGAVSPSMNLSNVELLLLPTPRNQLYLKQLLAEQRLPGSPYYRHWLTPKGFGRLFGTSQADSNHLRKWLTSQGFRNIRFSNARTMVSFSGTAAQVAVAFHTQIHHFRTHGSLHFSNVSDISVPSTFSSLINGVRGLDDFKPVPRTIQVLPKASPGYTMSYGAYGLAPGDIATIYGLDPLYGEGLNGSGVNVAVVGQTDINTSDLLAYDNGFNLPAQLPTTMLVTGSPDPGISSADIVEADLDLELIGAVARGSRVIYVNSTNVLDSLEFAIDQNIANVVSMSYGLCESDISAQLPWYELLAEQANAQGITLVAASGDSGAADCDSSGETTASQGLAVDFPADLPEVTGVGGTSLSGILDNDFAEENSADGGSALSYIPEKAWNMTPQNGYLEASGGGASKYFSKPGWQMGTGVPPDAHRDVPDLAFFSLNPGLGYIVCSNGDCASGPPNGGSSGEMWGGTSAAAPVFAGIVAVLNQYLVKNGQIDTPGLGNINPELYQLAEISPEVFHDIVQGDNQVPCASGTPDCTTGSLGFSAESGYDQVTGLGSVDAYTLAKDWGSASLTDTTLSLSTSSSIVDQGASITLTAKVVPTATAAVPSGTVIFYCDEKQIGVSTVNSSALASLNTVLPDGTHTIEAVYQGDTQFGESLAPALTESVLVPTTTSISVVSALEQPMLEGSPVTFTASVGSTAGTPTSGDVSFYSGTALLGEVALEGGSATLSTSNLPTGSDTVTAEYAGSSTFEGSESATIDIIVSQPGFTLSASPTTLSATSGGAASTTMVVTPVNGTAPALKWSCSGLTAGESCTFGAPSILQDGTETASLTINTATSAAANHMRSGTKATFALLPFSVLFWRKRRRSIHAIARSTALLLLVGALLMGLSGCTMSSLVNKAKKLTGYSQTVTVTAQDASGYVQEVKLSLQIGQ